MPIKAGRGTVGLTDSVLPLLKTLQL